MRKLVTLAAALIFWIQSAAGYVVLAAPAPQVNVIINSSAHAKASAAVAAKPQEKRHTPRIRHRRQSPTPVREHFRGSPDKEFFWKKPGGDPFSRDDAWAFAHRGEAFTRLIPNLTEKDRQLVLERTALPPNQIDIKTGDHFSGMVGGKDPDGSISLYVNVRADFSALNANKKLATVAPADTWPPIPLSDGRIVILYHAHVCNNWLVIIIPAAPQVPTCVRSHHMWMRGMRFQFEIRGPTKVPANPNCPLRLYHIVNGREVVVPFEELAYVKGCSFCQAIREETEAGHNVRVETVYASGYVEESGDYILEGPPDLAVPAYGYEEFSCLQDYDPQTGRLMGEQTQSTILSATAYWQNNAYTVQVGARDFVPEGRTPEERHPAWLHPAPSWHGHGALEHTYVWEPRH